jgi:hypothetical protein
MLDERDRYCLSLSREINGLAALRRIPPGNLSNYCVFARDKGRPIRSATHAGNRAS